MPIGGCRLVKFGQSQAKCVALLPVFELSYANRLLVDATVSTGGDQITHRAIWLNEWKINVHHQRLHVVVETHPLLKSTFHQIFRGSVEFGFHLQYTS